MLRIGLGGRIGTNDQATARQTLADIVVGLADEVERDARREERAEKIAATPEIEDVSVFPMAMPMLAGPGAIAAIMLLMNEAEGWPEMFEVLAALAAVLAITAAALVAAGPLIRLLGDKVEAVITRLLGVLLAALAAQYVIDGLKGSFGI